MTQKIRKLLVPLMGILTIAAMPRPLSADFISRNLVSDILNPPGGAPITIDISLKNPWGITASSTGPFWVSDQRTGVATIYTGNGNKAALTVTIPSLPGRQGSPTGVVFNGTSDFRLANGNPASFIFAGLDGTISAWNGGAGTRAELKATTPGAVYTGLAIGNNGPGNFLYAANVGAGKIDVFDRSFKMVSLSGSFSDPGLPAGYVPFNVQELGGKLYVTFQNRNDREHGGAVVVFDMNGNFLQRVAVDGPLNSPWGLAVAPGDFETFGNALLVGNSGLGDGTIGAFDPLTGDFLGQLLGTSGNPLQFQRLRALRFGNGGSAGNTDQLFFTAGINATGPGSFGAADGLFGRIEAEPVPEPGTLALLGTGLIPALALLRRRKIAG